MTATLLAMALISQAPKADWKPFKSPKGEFSAIFPAKPAEKKRAWKVGGNVVDLVTASVKRGVTSYEVSYGDLPAGMADDPKETLDAARDDVAKQLKGSVVGDVSSDWKGHPGRDLKIEVPKSVVVGGAVGRARLILAGRRLYLAVAVRPATGPDATAPDADRFLEAVRPSAEAAGPKQVERSAKVGSPAMPAGWSEYVFERLGIKATFPAKPDETEKKADTPLGPVVIHNLNVVVGEVAYQISCTELAQPIQGSGRGDFFAGVREGVVGKGKQVSTRVVKLGDNLGVEVSYEPVVPGGTSGLPAKARLFLIGRKSYTVLYIELAKGAADTAGDRFFDTFRLLDQGAVPNGPPAGTDRLAGWAEYAFDHLGMKAMFPSQPKEKDAKVTTRSGDMVVHNVNCLDVAVIYQISCSDFDPKAVEVAKTTLLPTIRKGVVGKGKLVSSRDVTLGDVPGLEYVYEPDLPGISGGMLAKARTFVVGRRVFTAVWMELVKGGAEANGETFLDSFRVTMK